MFPSGMEQGEPYRCDGSDLVKPTPEQYEKYSDGSHRGKKKIDGKAEAERKRAEVRTMAGETSKKDDVSKSTREVDLTESMRRREEQVAVQNAGKTDARKRDDILELERAAAQKKLWAEQQKSDSNQKKKRAKEEWQKNLAVEERKREDKIQFDKAIKKTVEIEGNKVGAVPVKLVANISARRNLTSAELDQEFRDLNAAQMKVNTRAAIEKLTGGEVNRKKEGEKSVTVGKRMMRAEDATVVVNRLPPIANVFSLGGKDSMGVAQDQRVAIENTKSVKEKKGKKNLAVPESVVEERDIEGGDDEFGIDQRTEVLLEISGDVLTEQVVEGPVEALSVTFLQDILSEGMEMGEEYDLRVQEVVQELEEPGEESEREYLSSRDVKEEVFEMTKENRKGGDGKRKY